MTRPLATVTAPPHRRALTLKMEAFTAGTAADVSGSVLLVDDDEVVRRCVTRRLVRSGYRVVSARNGVEALAVLEREHFHAVLSDIHMPHMTGLELLERLHAAGDNTPVVLLTGQADVLSAALAVQHGAVRYLSKPVDTETLLDAVRDAVRIGEEVLLQKRVAEAMRAQEARQREQTAELNDAFDEALKALWIAFQPIVHQPANHVYGFETLMRSRGRLGTPLAILEAAEALGRTQDLGRLIRKRIADCLTELDGNVRVFVNLHPSDLLDEELYAPKAPLSRDAHRVVLEITERAGLTAITDLAERVAKLRALGYRIAIDDLGAGYAGLMAIAQLEPEVVKLDMSLVRNLETQPTKRSLIGGMLAIAAQLGTQVIAEGVETLQECDALAALGCKLMQGYFFAKPLPLPEALASGRAFVSGGGACAPA
jgi:EAL domain-containing protein (putative c-di-GMP-specific phosphodiesterase class I)